LLVGLLHAGLLRRGLLRRLLRLGRMLWREWLLLRQSLVWLG
jgi:hypothetical protein